jgi:hypothetical protein
MKYKYEYLLHCWGGFWNKHNVDIHKEPDFQYKWFNTKEERQIEINRLDAIQEKYKFKDGIIARSFSEGYLTRFQFVIQSIVEDNGELQIIENNLGYGFYDIEEFDEFGDIAQYMKEWKYDICANLTNNHKRLFTTLILKL